MAPKPEEQLVKEFDEAPDLLQKESVANSGVKYVTVKGNLRVRYTDEYIRNGQSPVKFTLLFVHGFMGCLETWSPVIRDLKTRTPDQLSGCSLRIVTLDLIGCGKSARPVDWPYTFQDQGDVVFAFIEELILTNIVLVGHSAGAIAIAHAAATSGSKDQISKLVFIAPGFFPHVKPPTFLTYWIFKPLVSYMAKSFLLKRMEKLREQHLNLESLTPEITKAFEDSVNMPNALEILVANFRQPPIDSAEILLSIKGLCPVHTIWGEGDIFYPPVMQEKMDEVLSEESGPNTNSTSVVISETGHYVQHEQPDTVSREILSLIE